MNAEKRGFSVSTRECERVGLARATNVKKGSWFEIVRNDQASFMKAAELESILAVDGVLK